jgi:hypothetical protein
MPSAAELVALPLTLRRIELSAFLATAKTTAGLSEARLRALEEKLDYLVDSAKRQAFYDWYFLALGTFLAFHSPRLTRPAMHPSCSTPSSML